MAIKVRLFWNESYDATVDVFERKHPELANLIDNEFLAGAAEANVKSTA